MTDSFGPVLPRGFYARPTTVVARELLGKILVHGAVAGRIVETEAYLDRDEQGRIDLAAHSAAGITSRTRVIFGPPGHAYVYLAYGIHECLNIVAEQDGLPGCVLIRALEPVAGLELMRARRPSAKNDGELANGPGKLTRAMGITRRDYGADVTSGELTVRDAAAFASEMVLETARIGITKCVDWQLRYLLQETL